MSATLTLEGVAQLRALLRGLPDELTAEAQGIINRRAQAAAAEIKSRYPHRSGLLADGVQPVTGRGRARWAGALVINTTKYAQMFESGSVNGPRETGNFENRGVVPARPTFVPIMVKHRDQLYGELAAMVESHGLEVTGRA